MKRKFFCATVLLMITSGLVAQHSPHSPVVKAQSPLVDIRDGLHFKKGFWHLSPQVRPARYYVELPAKEHRVIFYTDIDSIPIDIAYGGVYNFVILLNDKDSCFTQVIASAQGNIKASSIHDSTDAADTIRFVIGRGNSLMIKAAVNQSDSLNLQLDLGSKDLVLQESPGSKSKVNWDSTTANGRKMSARNQLAIGTMRWNNVPFVEDKQGGMGDGIIGNSLFQDKIVEIDYDKQLLIVHGNPPVLDTGFSRHEMILDEMVPMLQASLATHDTSCTTWFVFKTGDSGNGWIDDSTAAKFKLYRGVSRIISWGDRVVVKLPELRVANLSFYNISAVFAKRGSHAAGSPFLGNSILKRFNVVLDNRNGFIYLKPNSLRAAAYDNAVLYIWGGISLAFILLFLVALAIASGIRRRKRSRALTEAEFQV